MSSNARLAGVVRPTVGSRANASDEVEAFVEEEAGVMREPEDMEDALDMLRILEVSIEDTPRPTEWSAGLV